MFARQRSRLPSPQRGVPTVREPFGRRPEEERHPLPDRASHARREQREVLYEPIADERPRRARLGLRLDLRRLEHPLPGLEVVAPETVERPGDADRGEGPVGADGSNAVDRESELGGDLLGREDALAVDEDVVAHAKTGGTSPRPETSATAFGCRTTEAR